MQAYDPPTLFTGTFLAQLLKLRKVPLISEKQQQKIEFWKIKKCRGATTRRQGEGRLVFNQGRRNKMQTF